MQENTYLSGFGNEQSSEAVPGALPIGRNSPQKPPLGLYTEQLSGSAFTVPRGENRRAWLYRLRPSAVHPPYRRIDDGMIGGPLAEPTPNRLRWDPPQAPDEPVDMISGLLTLLEPQPTTGGVAVLLYNSNYETNRIFCNSDGEMLIVPQSGRLRLETELGRLVVSPGEIAVVPRGMRFRTGLPDGSARGYIAENRGAMLRLPDLGPIGANGLANPRDFLCPTARYEDSDEPVELVQKFSNRLWATTLDHSPLDVVAWHGNLVPYKYDLARFNVIGTVSFDHPDPSIFTVLTSPSSERGTANMDFVIFPPRWMVAEDTFRPPWFHRNVMNECMGLIHGAYDAKEGGFLPGGMSLHPMMSAHGPDLASTRRAMEAELKPQKLDNTLAFMFETRELLVPTRRAMALPQLQADYDRVWDGLDKMFTG